MSSSWNYKKSRWRRRIRDQKEGRDLIRPSRGIFILIFGLAAQWIMHKTWSTTHKHVLYCTSLKRNYVFLLNYTWERKAPWKIVLDKVTIAWTRHYGILIFFRGVEEQRRQFVYSKYCGIRPSRRAKHALLPSPLSPPFCQLLGNGRKTMKCSVMPHIQLTQFISREAPCSPPPPRRPGPLPECPAVSLCIWYTVHTVSLWYECTVYLLLNYYLLFILSISG